MNMFQLQERIKDFSKDQLVKEMQQPSGAVPPFLVLSELQRRTRMEKAFQAEQAQGQQSTVAQDAIAAAGVPQGGIADMARAMAPQTDMTGNTGAAPVQGMYGGGQVRRMKPGGLTPSAREGYLIFLDQMNLADSPRSQEMYAAMMARQRENPPSPSLFMPGIDRAPQNLALSDVDTRLSTFMPGAEAPAAPVRQPSGLGPAPNADTLSVAAAATAPAPARPAPAPESYFDTMARITQEALNVASDMDLPVPTFSDSSDAAPALMEIEPQIDTSGAYSALLNAPSRAEAMFGDVGPLQGAMQPEPRLPRSVEDAARMMELNDIPFAGGEYVPPPSDRDAPFDLFEYMRGGTEAGPALEASDPRVTVARIDRELQNPDLSAAERQALESQRAGAIRLYNFTQGADDMFGDAYALTGRVAGTGIEKFGDVMAGLGFPRLGAPVIEFGQAVSGSMDPIAESGFVPGVAGDLDDGSPLAPTADNAPQMDTGTPLTVPEEADGGIESLLAPPRAAPPGGPRTSDTGGAGARSTGTADADKWLALAQFGLGLMASQAPTLGGAIGESGIMALGQLRESRKEAFERDLAERTLAARSAGGSGSQFPAAGANLLNSQVEALIERLADPLVTRDSALRDNLQSQLDTLLAQQRLLQAAYLSQYGLSGALNASAPAGDLSTVRANVSDE